MRRVSEGCRAAGRRGAAGACPGWVPPTPQEPRLVMAAADGPTGQPLAPLGRALASAKEKQPLPAGSPGKSPSCGSRGTHACGVHGDGARGRVPASTPKPPAWRGQPLARGARTDAPPSMHRFGHPRAPCAPWGWMLLGVAHDLPSPLSGAEPRGATCWGAGAAPPSRLPSRPPARPRRAT